MDCNINDYLTVFSCTRFVKGACSDCSVLGLEMLHYNGQIPRGTAVETDCNSRELPKLETILEEPVDMIMTKIPHELNN